jgi:hypothetical protein
MRPKKPQTTGEGDLFRARIDQIINMKHELVQLAGALDWEWLDAEIAPLLSAKGRPRQPHQVHDRAVAAQAGSCAEHSGGGQFVAHVAARYRSEPVSCYFVCSMPRDGMNVCSPS